LKVSTTSEKELWQRFKRGDTTALEYFFKTYHPLLLRYGSALRSDESEIEDCIQDLFLNLWNTRAALSDVNSVKYYLIASLRRLMLKKIAQQRIQPIEFADPVTASLPVHADYQNQLIQKNELERQETKVAQAIDNLPTRQKEALQLKYLQNKSYSEITEHMGINYQTARKFVYHALRNLRKQLACLIL